MPSHKAWAGLQPSQPGAHFKGSVLTGRDQMKLSCEVKNVLRGGREEVEAFFSLFNIPSLVCYIKAI